jgi:hypothetical protein
VLEPMLEPGLASLVEVGKFDEALEVQVIGIAAFEVLLVEILVI